MYREEKAGIIGEKESIMGFLPLGLMLAYASTAREAQKKLSELLDAGCAVIYVTDRLYDQMDLSAYQQAVTPVILPIPGISDRNRIGVKRLKKAVEKAVGADILFGDEGL